jgi:hypothetical protein
MKDVYEYFISYGKPQGMCIRDYVHTAYPKQFCDTLRSHGYVIYTFKLSVKV